MSTLKINKNTKVYEEIYKNEKAYLSLINELENEIKNSNQDKIKSIYNKILNCGIDSVLYEYLKRIGFDEAIYNAAIENVSKFKTFFNLININPNCNMEKMTDVAIKLYIAEIMHIRIIYGPDEETLPEIRKNRDKYFEECDINYVLKTQDDFNHAGWYMVDLACMPGANVSKIEQILLQIHTVSEDLKDLALRAPNVNIDKIEEGLMQRKNIMVMINYILSARTANFNKIENAIFNIATNNPSVFQDFDYKDFISENEECVKRLQKGLEKIYINNN